MHSSPLSSAMLTASPGLSLHRQVYMVVRENILSGLWPPGSTIPPEETLREQFGVSRVTVRRALSDLAAMGLIERRHGFGTFVADKVALRRPDPTLQLLDGLAKSAAESQVQVLEVRHAQPPPLVGNLLRVPADGAALHVLRLRSIDKVPVMLSDVWVPDHLGRQITTANLKKRPIYELLLAQGLKFGRVVQSISAVAADPKRARLLQTDVGAPLITLTRLIHDEKEQPVYYITAYLSPERSQILSEIAGDQMNTLATGQLVHDGLVRDDAR